MKKEYTIFNLHCGGCASKIQYALDRIECFEEVNVDFYTKKLRITLTDDIEEKELLNMLNEIAEKIEPGVFFKSTSSEFNEDNIEFSKTQNHQKQNIFGFEWLNNVPKQELIVLIIGIILFIIGLVLPNSRQKIMVLIIAYILSGYDVLYNALKNIGKGKFLDENFLMSVATIGALFLGDFAEAAGVMIFYKIGEFFQEMAINNSRKSIESLMSIKPEFANIKNADGIIETVNPSKVLVGNIIVVKPGERIPLDGIVEIGTTMLDKSTLTGESAPVLAEIGDEILSGAIVIDGTIEIKVTKIYSESTVSRIIEMVQSAGDKKAISEKFITKFARYYTPIVVLLAIFISLGIPLMTDGNFKLWIERGLVFLVISCPCALVLSVPLTFFSSIGKAAKTGILIKGGNYLERLKNIDTVVFDKTGTLTKGSFKVTKIKTLKGTELELIEYAKAGEFYSNHPIGKAILNYSDIEIKENDLSEHKEKAGYGVSVKYKGKSVLVGNEKFIKENGIDMDLNETFGTVVYIAVENEFIGIISVEDEIKENSAKTIEELKKMNVDVYMLTGDNNKTGKHIGEILGLDLDKICTELLPQDKVKKLEEIKHKSKKGTIFVGDGINDAPVLAIADIGISMGKIGSDIAIESSDIVLMNDDPYKIINSLFLGKLNNKVVLENVVLALGVKIIVMILGAFGIVSIWLAIFADVGVSIIAILNASKILKK